MSGQLVSNAAPLPPPHAGGLDATDLALIAALGAGRTVKAAARAVGVNRCTVQRRARNPEFREALRDAYAELYGDAARYAASRLMQAVKTLNAIMMGRGGECARVRLAAAQAMIHSAQVLDDRAEVSWVIADYLAQQRR